MHRCTKPLIERHGTRTGLPFTPLGEPCEQVSFCFENCLDVIPDVRHAPWRNMVLQAWETFSHNSASCAFAPWPFARQPLSTANCYLFQAEVNGGCSSWHLSKPSIRLATPFAKLPRKVFRQTSDTGGASVSLSPARLVSQ